MFAVDKPVALNRQPDSDKPNAGQALIQEDLRTVMTKPSQMADVTIKVGRGLNRTAPGVKKTSAAYWPVFFFMSFMLHESPQQHSCLSEDELAVAPVVLAAPSFISHESPQQHSCLSDDVA